MSTKSLLEEHERLSSVRAALIERRKELLAEAEQINLALGVRGAPSRNDPHGKSRAAEMCREVEKSPGLTCREIQQRVGMAPSSVPCVLSRLVRAGRLRREGEWGNYRYFVPLREAAE